MQKTECMQASIAKKIRFFLRLEMQCTVRLKEKQMESEIEWANNKADDRKCDSNANT